ncbi:MAG TPA: S8/S53 family peptidase, partial [Micromonospora sp.]
MSRRQLLALAVTAATAGPLGVLASPPGRAAAGTAEAAAYQQAFRQVLGTDPEVRLDLAEDRGIAYRPRQLLVANADTQRVVTRLREYGWSVVVGNTFAGVTKLRFDREVDVPAVVRLLRDPQKWPGQPAPRVQPHHVTVGYGNIMGNPDEPPRPAAPLPAPDPARGGEGAGVTVGVCDTGIWHSAGSFHPSWIGGSYLPQLDDEDPLYTGADLLALQGGHGTFVAGVVRQAAPGVSFDPERALSSSGVGDEEMLVAAMGRLGSVSIVNLSLGYHTLDDVPPLPVANAIAALPPDRAVVASAGNAATSRPAWPAALPQVVAVAAVRRSGGTVA